MATAAAARIGREACHEGDTGYIQAVGDAFELVDPRSAQDYLRGFEAANRRQGEIWFRGGTVRDLAPVEEGTAYSAVVEDHGNPSRADVALRYDASEGWEGDCTCPVKRDCGHVYAAMCALLAEHSTAVVRSLSSGFGSAGSVQGQGNSGKNGDLMGALFSAMGRPLRPAEKRFVEGVRSAFFRCRRLGVITAWDFAQMGLVFPAKSNEFGVGTSEIWPAPPSNEMEFWLFVACAAWEHSVAIPEFMEAVTDLTLVKARFKRWRRGREIEKWKTTLENLRGGIAVEIEAAPVQVDLRVVIGKETCTLQWRLGDSNTYERPAPGEAGRLWEDVESGKWQLTMEGEIMRGFLERGPYSGSEWSYDDPAGREVLGRIIRTRILESRVVTATGQPLARPTAPLRWSMATALDPGDDYRFSLVQDDGSAAGAILCVFPGRLPLYLAGEAVYRGPPLLDGVMGIGEETRIPAPALERASGIVLLQTLGVEMPPRLRERVRTFLFEVGISCELSKVRAMSSAEECSFCVAAEAPDGHEERLIGSRWVESSSYGKRRRRDATITVYDRGRLEETATLLAPLKLKWDPYRGQHYLRATRNFGEQFGAWLKSLPGFIKVRLGGELASFGAGDVAGRVRLEVAEAEIDWFDLKVALEVSDTTLTPEEIKLLLNARGRYVRLAGKGWRRLEFDLSAEDDERLAKLGLSPHELTSEPQRLHALQLCNEAAKKFLPELQVEQIRRRADEIRTRVAPVLPVGVTADLRPYQLEGFHFLAYLATNHFGGILADDMGLGKTLQTLAWLVWLRQQSASRAVGPAGGSNQPPAEELPGGAARASLVVCPKSVMDNWQAEAARFTPGLRVKVWHSQALEGFPGGVDQADLHVLNYAQMRSLADALEGERFQAVILDEGQYIKNPSSQTSQVARALRAEHRLVLTGTPIENQLLDLWSLMAFAMPGMLGSRQRFGRIYDAKDDPLARQRLAARVRPFLIRRTKGQVAQDLPDRIEEDLFCEIEGEQQVLYRAELKRARQMLLAIKTQKELAGQQFHFLVSLLRLRQICCHPGLVSPDTVASSAKTEALIELLEPLMAEGNKVLVFSQFVALLELIEPVLKERGWPVFYLAGDTEDRGTLVSRFQSWQGSAIFLISLKAGGFGLNLTAATYVVLFDPWWNPAVENQAIDRTHRIGQTSKVIAYRLLIKNSVEEKIRQLQRQKKALAQDVLGEERFTQNLTLEDLQFLFME